jgi:hypothetical protein
MEAWQPHNAENSAWRRAAKPGHGTRYQAMLSQTAIHSKAAYKPVNEK